MLFSIILSWSLIYALGYLMSLLFVRQTTPLMRVVLSFGFGTGAVALLMSVLGILYNFQFEIVVLSYSALAMVLIFLNREKIKFGKLKIGKWSVGSKRTVLASCVVLIFVASSLFHIAYFPDLYVDAPIYMQWAKILFNDKKVNFVEGGPTIGLGFASNYPSAHQSLSAFIYNFTGEGAAPIRLTSLLMSMMLILLVYEWSKSAFGNTHAPLLSVLVAVSLPFIIFFSRSSSHYVYLTFHFSLACYFLHRFLSKKNKTDLYQSFVFGGFAASTSYLGLSFLPLSLLTFQVERKLYKNVLLSMLLMVLVASPWYLKNLAVLGNPLWPFGGGKYIDPKIQANSIEQLNEMSKVAGFNYETVGDLKNSVTRLLFSYVNPRNAYYYQGLNPFFTLLAIPAIILWLKAGNEKNGNGRNGDSVGSDGNDRKKIQFFVFWMLIYLAFYLFISSYWNRYLILLSVPTVFLSTYLINLVVKKSHGVGTFWGRLIRFGLVFSIAAVYFYSIYLSLFWENCQMGHPNQVLENLGDHERIMQICYGGDYELWAWVNENVPADATVATTDFLKLYYYNRTTLEFNSWWLRDLQYSSSIEESVNILKQGDIDYLAITGETHEFDSYPQYFEPLKRIDEKAVYRVV